MARPKKKKYERRDCVLPPIRCTHTERATIKANAAQASMSVSDYVREGSVAGDKIIVREPLADIKLIMELNACGVNLNQLTRKAHILEEVDAAHLREVLARLSGLLDELMQ